MLKLDVDRPRPLPYWRVWWLARLCGWHVEWISHRRTPGRGYWHIEVGLTDALRAVEVVAAQAILGSDRNREAFNLVRARMIEYDRDVPRYWRQNYNVLFDRKVAPRGNR